MGTQGPEVGLASQFSWLSQERVSKGCVPEASSRTTYSVPNTVPSHQEAQLPIPTQDFPTLGQNRESFCTVCASPRMVAVVSHRFQPVRNLSDRFPAGIETPPVWAREGHLKNQSGFIPKHVLGAIFWASSLRDNITKGLF